MARFRSPVIYPQSEIQKEKEEGIKNVPQRRSSQQQRLKRMSEEMEHMSKVENENMEISRPQL